MSAINWDTAVNEFDKLENSEDKALLLKRLMGLTYIQDNSAHQAFNMVRKVAQERFNKKKQGTLSLFNSERKAHT